jgi:hypothetical protein
VLPPFERERIKFEIKNWMIYMIFEKISYKNNCYGKVMEDYVSKFLQYLRNIQCLGWGGDFLQIYKISSSKSALYKIKVNNK